MCPVCGHELCKSCKECHNVECERYVQPSDTCEGAQGISWHGAACIFHDGVTLMMVRSQKGSPAAEWRGRL